MSIWSDVFNIFTYSSEPDPLSRVKDTQRFQPVGITQPDALNYETGGGLANLRQTTEFIDTTTLTSRPMRYKEYQRLRNVPEIEMAMQGIADEACIAGDTKIATPFGFITIKELVETKAGERFLVYCFDFEKNDYTLGWAYNPRVVREAETVTVILDNGSKFTVTADHRILKSDGTWIEAGKLKYYDELMPFYRLPANFYLTKQKHSQYSRIFSFQKGWIHERQFINDWKTGKVEESYEKYNKASKMIGNGVPVRTIQKIMDHDWNTIQNWFKREGFSHKEIKVLYKNENKRRVIGIEPGPKQEVYDLSVDKHQCFATDSVIMHNCQKDENGNILKINVQNREIKEELEFVLFHRKMFNLNRTAPVWFKNLIINGDLFLEMVINEDNPKDGFYRAVSLPPEQIFRIETIKGRLLEFQQAKDAPDIKAAIAGTEGQANVDEKQTNVIRFHPGQLIHIRIGDDRQTFYPYGQSLIEPARGPAHSLRLMEDAMLVYRLCLTEDARVRTDNGWKYIKDINKNDCVYTFCPDGHLVKSYVENQVCNGKKEIYRVRSKHIEIKGTETHPILVDRDGVVQYVDIKDIRVKKDKFLCIPHESNVEKTIPRIFQKPWAKLSKNMRDEFRRKKYENKSVLLKNCYNSCRAKQFLYQEGKALPLDKAIGICKLFDLNSNELVIINKGECNSNRINIPKIVDKDFARLFGFIYGDGNIREHQINFTTGEDSSVNEKYRALLENYFGKVSFQLDKRSKKGHGKQVVNSTIACEIFKALGYEKNHNTCRVPGWIFNCSKEIRKAFVEGFSDADGCERYTKNGTWFSTIELSNKGLVEDIKELWSSIGLCSGHIKERHRKGGHEITKGRIMPASTSYSVTISECLLPKFENINSVEYTGEEDVYDITVSNPEHNFIVNGTCVHNTRAPERRVFYIDVGQLPPFKAEA
jgi:intein/homing endonuclease